MYLRMDCCPEFSNSHDCSHIMDDIRNEEKSFWRISHIHISQFLKIEWSFVPLQYHTKGEKRRGQNYLISLRY